LRPPNLVPLCILGGLGFSAGPDFIVICTARSWVPSDPELFMTFALEMADPGLFILMFQYLNLGIMKLCKLIISYQMAS
jgi:hypothetical protein